MTRWLMLVAVMSTVVHAQEIGTEIVPSTPTSAAQTPQQQPAPPPSFPQPEPKASSQPPAGQASAKSSGQRGSGAPTASAPALGDQVSAGAGSFGLRTDVGFRIGGVGALGTAVTSPSIGFAYWLSNNAALTIGLGAAVVINATSGAAPFSMTVSPGLEYYFRSPSDSLRPFFFAGLDFAFGTVVSAGVGTTTRTSVGFSFGPRLGFGAAYFFSPHFAFGTLLAVYVPFRFNDSGLIDIGITTVAPTLGGAWYF